MYDGEIMTIDVILVASIISLFAVPFHVILDSRQILYTGCCSFSRRQTIKLIQRRLKNAEGDCASKGLEPRQSTIK